MSRKSRAAETQVLAADRFKELYPYATDAGSGRGGRDILNTDGISVEVKARANFDPLSWIRQAVRQSTDGEVPMVVFRCNGQGPTTVDDWPVMIRFGDVVNLLASAGYGHQR